MQQDRERRILDTALEVFARHGFRRVTMGELAKAAGLSRPSLYNSFSSKEAVFEAVMRDHTTRTLATLREDLEGIEGTAARLTLAFEAWVVAGYELVSASPDAADLVECANGFAAEAFADTIAAFEALLTEVLEPHREALLARGQDPAGLARLLGLSAKGLKLGASSVDELRELLAGLVQLAEASWS